ncbi:MobC family plasmid mobilization relaxosome protein [Anaerotignum sp.]|uniref:MobC family plasmid mobilization relaxosome protein n=1 Tax=Anaerotignum sp. TaxID=2039241 RepID=UPI0028B080F4|nr:MobC family plasmid mobilization relaxosome protein [Anaerotignum sp.]
MANRKRNKPVFFRVDEEEYDLIKQKMQLIGLNDMGTYLRRMAIYGYMVEVDMEPLNRLTVELSRIGNNLNQLTKRANETGNIYMDDIEVLGEDVKKIKDEIKQFTGGLVCKMT